MLYTTVLRKFTQNIRYYFNLSFLMFFIQATELYIIAYSRIIIPTYLLLYFMLLLLYIAETNFQPL